MFGENDGGLDYKKSLLHAKRWDVCINEKENIIKGRYLLEFLGHDGKKVLWEVANDHVVEEATDNDEIGLWGFNLI